MNDVVLEWIIPYVMPAKKRLLKAVLVSSLIVLLADAVLFYPILALPAAVLGAVEFFLFRSWKLEYEYVYVNGDFTISKIIRKAKRKDVFRCDRKDIQYLEKGKRQEAGCTVSDFSSGWEKARVYTLRTGNRLVYMEPSDEFLQEMSLYRKVR